MVGHLFKSRIQRTFEIFPLKHWIALALYQEKCAVHHMVSRISNSKLRFHDLLTNNRENLNVGLEIRETVL